MAKKKINPHKKTRKTLEEFFYFENTNEFIIFLIWGLFVSAFLSNIK